MTTQGEVIGQSQGTDRRQGRQEIRLELEGARQDFHELLAANEENALDRSSDGTRWTNRQLLFHMMFGYVVVRSLLPLVNVVSRLPASIGRGFADTLNAVTVPFNSINYWGSVLGARLYCGQRMVAKFDTVITALERRLDREPEANMGCSMPYPVRWDPFFKDVMTLADVYRYPTQHFEFHRRQLTLRDSSRTQTEKSSSHKEAR